jgi:hypothetical protein
VLKEYAGPSQKLNKNTSFIRIYISQLVIVKCYGAWENHLTTSSDYQVKIDVYFEIFELACCEIKFSFKNRLKRTKK